MLLKHLTQTSRHLDDLLTIDNPHFKQKEVSIFHITSVNKANSFDTEAPCLNLDLSMTNGIVSSKMPYPLFSHSVLF